MECSSVHQSNMLAEQVCAEIHKIQTNIMQALDEQTQENRENIPPHANCKQRSNILTDVDDDGVTNYARGNKVFKDK